MINDINAILKAQRLIGNGERIKSINFVRSHHLSMYIKISRKREYYLKAAPINDGGLNLKNEYDSLVKIFKILKSQVPEPIALQNYKGHTFLILGVLKSNPVLSVENLIKPIKMKDRWIKIFGEMFQIKENKILPLEKEVIDDLRDEFPQLITYLECKFQKRSFNDILKDVPSIPQHGDLTIYNIGYNNLNPVIYDWEDFGRVNLSGSDIAMLAGSLYDYSPRNIISAINGLDEAGNFFRTIIRLNGLSVDMFITLLPLYFGVFWWLKKKHTYREDIQVTAINALNECLRVQQES